MQNTKPPLVRLTRARVSLLIDHPFYGSLASQLPNQLDSSIPTACTNGEWIKWNPDFVASLTDEELKAVVVHEVMHVANGHTWRRGARDHQAWNISCDLAINHIIAQAGFKLPKCGLVPSKAQEGKSAEALYAAPKGKKDGQKPGNGVGGNGKPLPGQGDPGGCGEVQDAPGGQTGKAEQEAKWKVAVVQAATQAKLQGKLPAGIERMVEELVTPKVPWSVVLRDFVERTARNDYNWSRPNVRFAGAGVILPTLISEELPEIVVAVDTSGSIGGKELDQFASEISAVLGAYETTIRVVYADAEVAHHHTVTRADLPLKLEPKGGGGTDFRPVFDWIEKEHLSPACTVYLTDLMGSFPTHAPEYPVLWVTTHPGTAPWGETIQMN